MSRWRAPAHEITSQSMNRTEIDGLLAFLRAAEALKHTHRSAWTSTGERESTAEHTWRLCLFALLVGEELGVDVARLLAICVVHDLGEAVGGDIPAVAQSAAGAKAEGERRDLAQLVSPLPERMRARILELWDEYESAATPEARLAKALDKLETILQHNQGANPPDFDYAFNLGYGRAYTAGHPLIEALRALLDADTAGKARP